MKKVRNLVIGGLQNKIFNLVLISMILVVGAFALVLAYQVDKLQDVVNDNYSSQLDSIINISSDTIDSVTRDNMRNRAALEAEIADKVFSGLYATVSLLGQYTEELLRNPDAYPRQAVLTPDKVLEFETAVQLLAEESVDLSDPEIMDNVGLLGNLSELMKLLFLTGTVNSCFVAGVDGTMLIADNRAMFKLEDDGTPQAFPVRYRPWYRYAASYGEVCFTDVEKDAFASAIGIICAMPIYIDGELAAVVGADLFLNSLEAAITQSSDEENGFLCIINEYGHVILAPDTQDVFTISISDEAVDFRKAANTELAEFVQDALTADATDVRIVHVNGVPYYMAAQSLPTVGWALIYVKDWTETQQPTKQLQSNFEKISNSSLSDVQLSLFRSLRSITILVLLILAAGIAGSLLLSKRIVKPINTMAQRMGDLSGSNLQFKMEDVYRTKDEIEVLATAFADLSAKTCRYIEEIKNITAEKERIGAELDMAKDIQASQLPSIFPPFPDRKEIDLYASMTPAKEVGGDFYDFFWIDHDHLGLVMADVSGKGVPAALFMMIAKILIKSHVQSGETPGEALANVNAQLLEGNQTDMFVTVWLAVLDIRTGEGVAANAGHEHPTLRQAGGGYELVKYRHSPALGTMEGIPFREHTFVMKPGDSLFVYTDGVPEANNEAGELFGNDRMLEALNIIPEAEPRLILRNVRQAIDLFVSGAEQFDDITMLCLRYNGAGQEEKEQPKALPEEEMTKKEEKAAAPDGQTAGEETADFRELTVAAERDKLPAVLAFVETDLETAGCPLKAQMQIAVAVEEIFVNIASYAYREEGGTARIRIRQQDGMTEITFQDEGIPYNPLEKEDPDVTLSAEERGIGGLGIFMVKKTMDEVCYEYKDGKNILTIRKKM